MDSLLLKEYADRGKSIGIDCYVLDKALEPRTFSAMTADSLSIRQLSHTTGMTEKEVFEIREALYRLGAISRIRPNFAEDNILPLVENDQLTYDEIASMTGKRVQEVRACYIPYLKRNNSEVCTFAPKKGRKCGARLSIHKIFPTYARSTIVYMKKDGAKVAQKLANDVIPGLTIGKKKSLKYMAKDFPSEIKVPFLDAVNKVPLTR